MRADLGKILDWEKNYGGAYVPWAPELQKKTENIGGRKVDVLVPSTVRDANQLSGWRVGNRPNRSGVTVGAGVDLGAKSESDIEKLVDDGVSGTHLLDEEQAQALKDKLKLYAGKKRSTACQYLRSNPLTLTQDEVDTLNYSSLKNHLIEASKQYEKYRDKVNGQAFDELDTEEQTLILSKVYHTGKIDPQLAKAISLREEEKVFSKLNENDREYNYFKAYYDTLPSD